MITFAKDHEAKTLKHHVIEGKFRLIDDRKDEYAGRIKKYAGTIDDDAYDTMAADVAQKITVFWLGEYGEIRQWTQTNVDMITGIRRLDERIREIKEGPAVLDETLVDELIEEAAIPAGTLQES